MNNQTHGYQEMTAYLLGTLPADEMERFDELSFTDDEFAAQLQAAENDLVDAFTNGELSGMDLERFNSYYLASPLRREKTEFARAFQEFAKNSPEANKDLGTASDRQTVDTSGGFLSGLFTLHLRPMQWGFAAASVIVVILAGWLLLQNARQPGQTDEAREHGVETPNNSTRLPNVAIDPSPAVKPNSDEIAQADTENGPIESEKAPKRPVEQKQSQQANTP